MTFPAAYPGAIVVPADPRNYYGPGSGRRKCWPLAIIYHTPQEPSDDRESTPVYFSTFHPYDPVTGLGGPASTRYYGDNDGDLYQMVPEEWGAVANGLDGKPKPYWALSESLNLQTDNIEIEGYAATLKETMTNAQWRALVDWSVWDFIRYGIPREEGRMMGHYELSSQRSDPGPWFLSSQSGFKAEVLARVNQYEKDVKALRADVEAQRRELLTLAHLIATGRDGEADARVRYMATAGGIQLP